MRLALALIVLTAPPVVAETVVPTRVIGARDLIGAGDVALDSKEMPGTISDLNLVIGREARVALYPGRPIRAGDIVVPAIVERNDLVTLIYSAGGLRISTEGRVLARGAAGEVVRVMNLSSRQSVMGRVMPDGTVEVR